MQRRQVLLGTTSAMAGIAGCSSPVAPRFIPGCDNSDEAVVKVKKVKLSSKMKDEVDLISYSNLSDAEKDMVRTAMKEGRYRECMGYDGFSDRLYSFRDRILEYATEEGHAYLAYEQDTYAVALILADQLVANLPDDEVITQER